MNGTARKAVRGDHIERKPAHRVTEGNHKMREPSTEEN
ncbi:Uncharacterised protein [Lysinibacillus capsici]|uniref:Uncharacterized protein n=1 Tax=Lysinibacillus capsici TaxID=2115968 RepID=A0A2X0YEK1_9BACI|nr:Uncharacterised protein [Lysinibacillus capsici]